MCGICGDLRFDGGEASAEAIAAMMSVMVPRGPDGGGMLLRNGTGFGHRRLKIIDLSEKAAQPMTDGELGLSIAFNGCIYNYPELRRELEGKGYRFFSTGDTEVILKAYHAWGARCVERFKGMFAFAIEERDSGRVVLARDRFGIKPLYLTQTPGRVRFASSLPALLASGGIDTSIDRTGLAHYMSFHAVVPAPHTILNGVEKLPPATIRTYEPDGRFTDEVYWQLQFERSVQDIERPFEEWRDMVLEALRAAVSRRMVADVPVGVLLSGGVDSSVIVGLLAEMGQSDLNTFSIGFEEAHGEKGDEFVYSDLIAEHYGTKHHKIFVPSSELLDALPETIGAQSEPMVSYDNVGFFLLSREVAKHIKVVQSGQGADEVFAGYHWYPPLTSSNDPVADYAKVFFDRDRAKLECHLNPDYWADGDAALDYVRHTMALPGADAAVDKALRLDSTVMLVDDPVKRVDNMTMSHGLEARVPFLDHELVELAARIPAEHKLAHGGKGVLKEASRKVIPSAVIDRKKGYFPVPALKYLAGPYLEMVRHTLTNSVARERGIFQQRYLETLFTNPTEHITPLRGSELWQVAVLEMWLQKHGI